MHDFFLSVSSYDGALYGNGLVFRILTVDYGLLFNSLPTLSPLWRLKIHRTTTWRSKIMKGTIGFGRPSTRFRETLGFFHWNSSSCQLH